MDAHGGPDVLHLRDVAEPVARPGEVVVAVHAASVNPADWKAREGLRERFEPASFPRALGRDFSGVVRAIGDGVEGLAAGEEVFGVVDRGRDGTYAQAIGIAPRLLATKPASLTHAEAAALALVGITALDALVNEARLRAGETILIHAGAGGVGGFAVQLAKHIGATVFATARAVNHDYVRALGADRVVDYAAVDFTTVVPRCDVVFDTVGGDVHARSFSVLGAGGRLVHVADGPEGFARPRDDVTVLRPAVVRDGRHLERIVELVGAGAVRPPEITSMPLADAARAQELSRAGHVRGKIVLSVPQP